MIPSCVIWSGCSFPTSLSSQNHLFALGLSPVNLFCISLSPLAPLNAPLSATSVSSLKSTPAEHSANVASKPLAESLKALDATFTKNWGEVPPPNKNSLPRLAPFFDRQRGFKPGASDLQVAPSTCLVPPSALAVQSLVCLSRRNRHGHGRSENPRF